MRRIMTTIIVTPLLIAAAGCSEVEPAAETTTTTPDSGWLLTAAPDGAVSVTEAKASASEGEPIVLLARVGGRKAPLNEGSAVFTVMDLAIPHCGDNPNDACRTPWDYCCETPETITANSATIQVLGADGQPISESPATQGVAPLDEVIVVGTVAPRPSEQVLTVRATGIYRMPAKAPTISLP